MRYITFFLGLCIIWPISADINSVYAQDLADQVIVRRTAYGVPHIKAENLRSAGYAMGYLQLEDYGVDIVLDLVRARGEWGKYNESSVRERENQIDRDAANRLRHMRAMQTFPKLQKTTQEMLEGFAEGVNRYIARHPGEFPTWIKPDFTGHDVHARGIGSHSYEAVKRFLQRLEKQTSHITPWEQLAVHTQDPHPDEGSNAWAFAPSRTVSGRAILLRNPHLSWDSGYYEAHMEVPGQLNFYGDFRIGSPIGIIGGFNEYLGWSTTNNYPDTDEIYALEEAVGYTDHYLLDGVAHPLEKQQVTVVFKRGDVVDSVVRDFLSTPYGQVIHRADNKIYLIRAAGDGEYRTSEQFLQMMMASNLEEWKQAMRIHAKTTSNFTYADRDGNIFYVWNAMIPRLSHPSGGDTTAVLVTQSDQIWKEIVPWDELPQLTNPKGGYLHNENDPFHYTNLNEVFDKNDFPANFAQPQLRLRSQLALELIVNDRPLSLEDVVELKHSMRVLLADRVKEDLISAVRGNDPDGEIAEAIHLLENWDNTVASDSRGGILFETWWNRYIRLANEGKEVEPTPASAGYAAVAETLFAEVWSPERAISTPRGLANPKHAIDAFDWAVEECKKRYGGWDLPWGDVHRARIGHTDLPVGGGTGDLGCFRVLWFVPHKQDRQKREIRGGDCWVLAVEFGDIPRAYSVLAYGQSNKEESPHFNDQLELFTDNKMKPVAFTEEDIQAQTVFTYHPGKE